jgi:hypothetical protein
MMVGDALGRAMYDLLEGSAGPDVNPPVTTGFNPANGASDVSTGANLVATFSESIVIGTGNITIHPIDNSGDMVIAITDATQVTVSGTTLTINPAANLSPSKQYAVQIDATAIDDLAGNSYAGITDNETWSFTTATPDTTDPTLSTTNPANGTSGVPSTANLVATFNESIAIGTGDITLRNLTDGSGGDIVIPVTDTAQVSISGSVLTVNPAANLLLGKTYAVQIAATAIDDLAGNSYAGINDDAIWSFTTAPPDLTAPSPDPMTFAVLPKALGETTITMTATTASDPSGVEYLFECTAGGGPDSGWQGATEFTPTGLTHSTTYSYTVRARDTAGNETDPSAPASATTASPNTTPPTLVRTASASGGNTSTSPSNITLSHSLSSGGNVLVVGGYVDNSSAGAGATLTFNGNAPTGRISSNRGTMAYYKTSALDTTVTISFTGSATSVGLVLWELSNVDLTAGVVSAAGGDTITTTKANTLVLGTGFRNGSATLTRAGAVYDTTDIAGFAILGNAGVTGMIGGASGLAETAGSQNISWNNDTDGSVLAYGFVSGSMVGPGPVASFTISPIASPQTVGAPITGITLTAKDASNATATGFTGTVTFGGTAGITGTSANFTAGVLTGVSVTPTVAGNNLTFTVDDGASHTGSTTIATIQTPYAAWAGSGVAFDDDANNDGVDNGMAWLLGAATPSENALNKLPAATRNGTSLRLAFRCLKSTKRGGTVLKVQSSNDLGVSDPWTNHEAAVPDADATVNGVVFDITADGDYISVIADIPAGGAKLFARLSAVNQ